MVMMSGSVLGPDDIGALLDLPVLISSASERTLRSVLPELADPQQIILDLLVTGALRRLRLV